MTAENEMLQQIFHSTEKLISQYGIHQLSMQKIAKEAGIAAGTIYIYFKSKEELLRRLAFNIFQQVQECIDRGVNPDMPLFEQYRQMWWNIWHFLHNNPQIILNVNQYKALPDFYEMTRECHNPEEDAWFKFVRQGQQSGQLANLPKEVLFSLSLESAFKMVEKDLHLHIKTDPEMLEKVIQHSWNAILPLA